VEQTERIMPSKRDFITRNDHLSGSALKVKYLSDATAQIPIQPIENSPEGAACSLLEPYR